MNSIQRWAAKIWPHNKLTNYTQVALVGFTSREALEHVKKLMAELQRRNKREFQKQYEIMTVKFTEIPAFIRQASKMEQRDRIIYVEALPSTAKKPDDPYARLRITRDVAYHIYVLRHILRSKTLVLVNFNDKSEVPHAFKSSYMILAWTSDDDVLTDEERKLKMI